MVVRYDYSDVNEVLSELIDDSSDDSFDTDSDKRHATMSAR